MDIQLQELLDTIRTEGVNNAEEQARKIRAEAEEQAGKIVADARKEAARILESATQDAKRLEQSGREALRQAGRDLILSLQKEIQNLIAAIIKKETKNVLTGKFLEEALSAVLSGWKENGETDLTVLVTEKLLENLAKALHSQLASAVKGGAELRPGRHVDYGFKVSMKGGTAYYNFTEEGIAEILGEYLNPRIAEILKKSVAGEG